MVACLPRDPSPGRHAYDLSSASAKAAWCTSLEDSDDVDDDARAEETVELHEKMQRGARARRRPLGGWVVVTLRFLNAASVSAWGGGL